MKVNRIDLNLLVYLDALLRERNVTQAANQLNLSQPAMSNGLRRLRELFNDPLLVRTSEGMTPTERALELEPVVRDVLSKIDQAVQPRGDFDARQCAARVSHHGQRLCRVHAAAQRTGKTAHAGAGPDPGYHDALGREFPGCRARQGGYGHQPFRLHAAVLPPDPPVERQLHLRAQPAQSGTRRISPWTTISRPTTSGCPRPAWASVSA